MAEITFGPKEIPPRQTIVPDLVPLAGMPHAFVVACPACGAARAVRCAEGICPERRASFQGAMFALLQQPSPELFRVALRMWVDTVPSEAFTEIARIAYVQEPRPGRIPKHWSKEMKVIPEEDLTQEATDSAIVNDLYDLLPVEDREILGRLTSLSLAQPRKQPNNSSEWVDVSAPARQEGGLHTDPVIRAFVIFAWGMRDDESVCASDFEVVLTDRDKEILATWAKEEDEAAAQVKEALMDRQNGTVDE